MKKLASLVTPFIVVSGMTATTAAATPPSPHNNDNLSPITCQDDLSGYSQKEIFRHSQAATVHITTQTHKEKFQAITGMGVFDEENGEFYTIGYNKDGEFIPLTDTSNTHKPITKEMRSPYGTKHVPTPEKGLGAGYIVNSEEGLVMTAAHVVDTAKKHIGDIRLSFWTGTESVGSVKAELIGEDNKLDIAVLKYDPEDLPKELTEKAACLKLADSNGDAGTEVHVVGSPYGIISNMGFGRVSGRMERDGAEFTVTDTAINTGNSGGPMIDNETGEAIGTVSFILTKGGGSDGIGFATSVSTGKGIAISLITAYREKETSKLTEPQTQEEDKQYPTSYLQATP